MRFIDAAELRSVLQIRMLVERLRQILRSECETPSGTRYDVPTRGSHDARVDLTPVWAVGRGIGLRIESRFPDNVDKDLDPLHSVFLLIDGRTGIPQAHIDGAALARRRAAAAAALSATYLARLDAERLLLVGAGRMALDAVEAFTTLLPIKHALIWDRDFARAKRLVSRFTRGRTRIEATDDLEGAARGAEVIVCATSSTEPLIKGEWLSPGAHLELIGSTSPEAREADDECMTRARVFVDFRERAERLAGDIVQPIKSGALRPDDIAGDLGELTRGDRAGRRFYDQITLNKTIGSPIEDLAGAMTAVEMAIHYESIR